MSLVGTWMQQVASGWLVYRLSGSALALGVVAFMMQAPIFVLTPIAGALLDHHDRRRILFWTQVLAMLQASVLAGLVFSGWISIEWVAALAFLIGIANAFDIPARQSMIGDMIERREDLPNALALHSTIFNGARLLGPPLAGLVIALWGEGACFAINAMSFVPILIALSSMRFAPRIPAAPGARVWARLREGVAWAHGRPPVRFALILLAFSSVTGMAYPVLLPVVAKEILSGDARTLGLLVGASGFGALGAALYLAWRKTLKGLAGRLRLAMICFGLCLALFSISRHFWLSMALMAGTGFGVMVQMVLTNTFLQTVADDDKRARVVSLYTMALIGTSPFGSLAAGALASRLGAPAALYLQGALCAAAPLFLAGSFGHVDRALAAGGARTSEV